MTSAVAERNSHFLRRGGASSSAVQFVSKLRGILLSTSQQAESEKMVWMCSDSVNFCMT